MRARLLFGGHIPAWGAWWRRSWALVVLVPVVVAALLWSRDAAPGSASYQLLYAATVLLTVAAAVAVTYRIGGSDPGRLGRGLEPEDSGEDGQLTRLPVEDLDDPLLHGLRGRDLPGEERPDGGPRGEHEVGAG